jgi:TfoX/Sxy family transcriptional regulator of competence genes
MSVNAALTKRVRDVLVKFTKVEEKKMFRGIAFMVNGKMCVTVGDTRVMCRIDPALHEELIQNVGVSTVKMKGRDYIGWVYVDETIVPDKRKLTRWIKLALDFNRRIK